MAQYHVTLNGQGLLLDLSTYGRRVAQPFAPKRAEGDPGYQDLALGGAYALLGFGDGHGQLRADPARPNAYRWGPSIDTFTAPGQAQLANALTSVGAGLTYGMALARRALAVWNGSLWLADDGNTGDTLVYEWDGSQFHLRYTWVGKSGGAGAFVTYLDRLLLSNAGDGAVIGTGDGTSWTQEFNAGAGADAIYALCVGQLGSGQYDKLYVVTEGVTNGVVVAPERARVWSYDYAAGLSANELYVLEERKCRVAALLNGTLYLFGAELSGGERCAIYSTSNGTTFKRLGELKGNAPLCGVVYRGKLYLGMARGEVWTWDGSTLERVCTLLDPQGARTYAQPIYAMATFAGALWVGRWDTSGRIGLERFDGTSWSLPYQASSATSATAVRALAPYQGALHLAVDNSGLAAGLFRVESASYATTATLETPVQDAGLPSVTKSLREATLTHLPLASGQSVQVQYRLEDAGGWTTLGTSSTAGATSATFTFPQGAAGKRFALRLVLAGPGTSTPALSSGGVR
jgi:hypothetical protein